jgi:hypothetical protein
MTGTAITKVEGSNYLAELRERLKDEHAAVAKALKTSLKHALTAGDILIEAKAQLEHGQWLPWLKSCGLSERTTQRYIRLARYRTTIEANPTTLSDLGISGALALLVVPRDSGDEVADNLTDLADLVIDSAFDFLNVETRQQKLVYKKQKALLAEAKAAVDKICGLVAKSPKLVEILETDSAQFSEQLVAACGDYSAARAAEMGFTPEQFDRVVAAVDDLKKRGADDYQIARTLNGKFKLADREPIPGQSPTAVITKVRDIAKDWLHCVEQRAAEATA